MHHKAPHFWPGGYLRLTSHEMDLVWRDGPSVAHVTSFVPATLSRSLTAAPLKNWWLDSNFSGAFAVIGLGILLVMQNSGTVPKCPEDTANGAFPWRVFTPNGFGGISLWKASTYR